LNKVVGVSFQAHSTLGAAAIIVLEDGSVQMLYSNEGGELSLGYDRFVYRELPPVPGTEAHAQRERRERLERLKREGWQCLWCKNWNEAGEDACSECLGPCGTRQPRIGDRFTHPELGAGRITGVSPAESWMMWVQFDSGKTGDFNELDLARWLEEQPAESEQGAPA
jgi:hypothetical protein